MMKNKNDKKSRGLFAILLVLTLATMLAAQTYKQGNSVETPDGRTGTIESFKNQEMAKVKFDDGGSQYFMLTSLKVIQPPKPVLSGPSEVFRPGDLVVNADGKQLKIDSIEGDTATVRYGVGKYNVYKVKLSQLRSAKTAASNREQENAGKLVRAQFDDEAAPFVTVIRNFSQSYNPKYHGFEISDDPAWNEKARKQLEALSVICAKFPNLTNRFDGEANNINHNQADWCRIAEQRNGLIGKMKLSYSGIRVTEIATRWGNEIDQAMRNSDGNVSEGLQMLLYERAAWEAKEFKKEKKNYDAAGVAIPSGLMTALDEKVAELKARIEREAPTRSWAVPDHKDPASEALATRGFPARFPGGKVFRTGMTFATWKSTNDTSLISTGSNGVKVYRTSIGVYRFKTGNALVKILNRPFCQNRAFSVGQPKKGGGFGGTEFTGFGEYGIFVKCP